MTDPESFNLENVNPPIIGRRCSDFRLLQLHDDLRVLDPAHIMYMEFEDCWYRFFFESTFAFCISGHAPPTKEDSFSYLKYDSMLYDSAIASFANGATLESLTYEDLGDKATLTFCFTGGSVVTLQRSLNSESTSIEISS